MEFMIHEIRQRRESGQTWRQIAKELGMSFWAVDYHSKAIQRSRKSDKSPIQSALIETK